MDPALSQKTDRLVSFFTLFSSAGTLICCALPALFVSLGLGAAFAGLVGTFPQIVWFSENKTLVFGVAGILISVSGILQYRARNAPCPLDPNLAQACMRARKTSRVILAISSVAYLLGLFFAFVL